MYHCGTAPALHHIANGMFGMVIVEPKGGLPKVDDEFAFVQSEWYLGAQGEPRAREGQPDRRQPLTSSSSTASRTSTRTTPWRWRPVGASGSSSSTPGRRSTARSTSSGTIFDQVNKEGVEPPPRQRGWLGLTGRGPLPAQGAIIEFTPTEDGLYPIVTHAFNLVTHGAIGIFSAGDGDPARLARAAPALQPPTPFTAGGRFPERSPASDSG